MSGPRVVLISRRFWPLVGGAETVMANLGEALAERQRARTLLTARWERAWPEHEAHRGLEIVRLRQSPWRWLGTWQYVRALKRWLFEHRQQFDLVYVSMFKHDAFAALHPARSWPVVIRAEGAGLTGDMHWQLEARGGRQIKRRCFSAEAFVAPSQAIEREIIAAGYPRDRIHLVPNAVPIPLGPPRDRSAARAALAAARPQCALEPEVPLVVFTGRLARGKGLEDLVDAWPRVLESLPEARLWLVGEGPLAAALCERIERAGLSRRVLLPGAFETVDDVLAAANVFLLPSHEEGLSLALLEALAAGLPAVVSDIPGNRQVVDSDRHALLVPPGQPAALAAAIVQSLRDPAAAAQRAALARQRVESDFSLSSSVEQHLHLFEQALARYHTSSRR